MQRCCCRLQAGRCCFGFAAGSGKIQQHSESHAARGIIFSRQRCRCVRLLAQRRRRPERRHLFFYLPFKAHLWATLSVGLKIFDHDMQTDWSFFFISLRGEPFESQYMLEANATRRFTQTGRYNPDVIAIQMASFFSCSCGTLLTFFDIYGTRQRLGGAVVVASVATLLVMLIEDVPQLAITIIYMKTMAAAPGATGVQAFLNNVDTISIISLIASILSLLFSIYLLISDSKSRDSDSSRPAPSATYQNPTFKQGDTNA